MIKEIESHSLEDYLLKDDLIFLVAEDFNNDGNINLLDIVQLVNIIIND